MHALHDTPKAAIMHIMHTLKTMQTMHVMHLPGCTHNLDHPARRSIQNKNPQGSLPEGFAFREAGIYLFSQAVSSQLSSAQVSLTSVFGMGTGGTSPSSTPAVCIKYTRFLAFCPDCSLSSF